MVDLWRDFWIRETGIGQQVAQLRDRYIIIIIIAYYYCYHVITAKNNTNFGKITGIQEKLDTTCK